MNRTFLRVLLRHYIRIQQASRGMSLLELNYLIASELNYLMQFTE